MRRNNDLRGYIKTYKPALLTSMHSICNSGAKQERNKKVFFVPFLNVVEVLDALIVLLVRLKSDCSSYKTKIWDNIHTNGNMIQFEWHSEAKNDEKAYYLFDKQSF